MFVADEAAKLEDVSQDMATEQHWLTVNRLVFADENRSFGFIYTISARRTGDLPRVVFEAQIRNRLGDNIFELKNLATADVQTYLRKVVDNFVDKPKVEGLVAAGTIPAASYNWDAFPFTVSAKAEFIDYFNRISVTEREMFELYVMHQAIEHYRGTPLEPRLERFFRRMAGQLDNEELFTLEDLGAVLSFRPSAPDEADAKLFDLVTRAVRERRWLRFDYRKPGEKKPERRRVQPYHVLEYGGRWYLLAYDPMRRDVRTFVLGRMREAVMGEERFERPKDFDARKHLESSIGVMAGKGDFQVVVQMDAWLTDILRGRRWHPSQVVEELPGGGSQLRLRLGALEEIVRSFEVGGRERLIEVKTTRFGELTPFFASRNEVEFSDERREHYQLCRVFGFREEPRLFTLAGSLRSSCQLEPFNYSAAPN